MGPPPRLSCKVLADLKVPFKLDAGVQRRDDTHVHEALREALVNTLIHADYDTTIPTLIVKHTGGFEFRNPGLPRLSLDEIRAGGLSDCRNRTLQRMFALVGMGETAGSGFSRILRAWREQSWRSPAFRIDHERETTTLSMSMASLLPTEQVKALENRFGNAFLGLDDLGRTILVTAATEGAVDHGRISELSGAHGRDITLKLQDLIRKGLLVGSGRRRQKKYQLPELGRTPNDSSATSSHPADTAHDASSHPADTANDASSHPADAASDTSSGPSDTSSGSSDTSSATNPPPSTQVRPPLNRVHSARRVPEHVTDAAILEICRGVFRTRAEISSALHRAEDTVRARFLPRLVRMGQLSLRFPDRPRHPEQAYQTVDDHEP